MGNSLDTMISDSEQEQEEKELIKYTRLYDSEWSNFLETCCELDENSFIGFNDLCSMFGYFLEYKKLYAPDRNYLTIATYIIKNKYRARIIKLTPGFATSGKTCTSLVLGIKIVNVPK